MRQMACPLWCRIGILIGTLMVTAGARPQTPAPPQDDAPRGDIEKGKRAYMSYYCFACHGTVGQGGRDGARLAPNPPAFSTIVRYVRRPSGQMPPYTNKVISDQELADIYAFLKSIPATPSAKTIPLLNR
jgi:mono/diheme cytochrome c family protein